MAVQWPLVAAALADLARSLPAFAGVPVYDGQPVTEDRPLAYLTVGYAGDEQDSGTFATDPRRNDGRVEERGEVRCQIVAQSGDTDLPTVRARAFALVDAFEESVRADPRFGVLSADGTSSVTADVLTVQNASGSAVAVTVAVVYLTRT